MALIPCPHCGKEISSYAKRCPGCGKDLTLATETVNEERVSPNPIPEQEIPDSTVDYNKIFMITEDEFEGNKTVGVRFSLEGNPEMDYQCERLHAKRPSIAVVYSSSAYGNFFTFAYYEDDLVNKINGLNVNEYDPRIGAPSRGLIVNVDGKENIKLNALGNKPIFLFDQENGQDLFLQCCKANSLEFKVFKQEGAPIVFKGTQEDQEILIDNLRALYNYIVDNSTFPDAGFKAQQWVNEHKDELQLEEDIPATSTNTDKPHGEQNFDALGDILIVENDEFNGSKFLYSRFGMSGNPELDSLCKPIYAEEPSIKVGYSDSSKGEAFFIDYDDKHMLKRLVENGRNVDAQRLSSPCKGIFIIIDGAETIKMSSDDGKSLFIVGQEQMLKCSNAHKLEFKVFKQEGDPIVISGSKEDEEVLIDYFRVLYGNFVDNTKFPGAGVKAKKWVDDLNEEIRVQEAELEKLKKEKEKSANNKKIAGIVILLIGSFLFVISLFFITDRDLTTCLALLGSGLFIVFIGGFICSMAGPPKWQQKFGME